MRIFGRIGVPAEVAQLVEQWSEEPCVASSILALGTVRGFLVIQENPAPRKSASNTVKPLCYRQTGIGIGGRSSVRCGRRGDDLTRRGRQFECAEWLRE